MQDFTDTKTASFYENAIGTKNQAYYIEKFELFDNDRSRIKVSWNWAAFFFGGVWFLYRKMYGWFFLSLAVHFIFTFLDKILERASLTANIIAAAVWLIIWLLFTAFANSLGLAQTKY